MGINFAESDGKGSLPGHIWLLAAIYVTIFFIALVLYVHYRGNEETRYYDVLRSERVDDEQLKSKRNKSNYYFAKDLGIQVKAE